MLHGRPIKPHHRCSLGFTADPHQERPSISRFQQEILWRKGFDHLGKPLYSDSFMKPYRMRDDLGWKAVAFVSGGRIVSHADRLLPRSAPAG